MFRSMLLLAVLHGYCEYLRPRSCCLMYNSSTEQCICDERVSCSATVASAVQPVRPLPFLKVLLNALCAWHRFMSSFRLWALRSRLKPVFFQPSPTRAINLAQPAKRLLWHQLPLRTPLAVGASAFAASLVLSAPGSRFALAEEVAPETLAKAVAPKTDLASAPNDDPAGPTEEDRKLVQVFERRRGWFLLGLLGQTILLATWASLLWLPALTVGVSIAVIRGVGPEGLRVALAGLLTFHAVPYLPISGLSMVNSDFFGDICLGWFQSAEIWVAEVLVLAPPKGS